MAASYMSAHPRAKNLRDKELLEEFATIELFTQNLYIFAIAIIEGMTAGAASPTKPSLPDISGKITS